MTTEIKITVRAYPVEIRDERTGEKMKDQIVLDKATLQAGAAVGMGDGDIIYRLYNRKGYRVLEIGNPVKLELTVDLEDLYNKQALQVRMEQLLEFGRAHSDARLNNQEAEVCDTE